MSRVHYRASRDGQLYVALCGWFGAQASRMSTDERAVDCRLCLARIPELSRPVPEPIEFAPYIMLGRGCRVAMPLPRRGTEDEQPRPWSTWRAAVRAYVLTTDDGPPLKSTSAPRRFETQVQGGPAHHQGDVAQRMVHRMHPVSRALGRAFLGPYVVMTTPRREVPLSLCMDVLIEWVVGRPVSMSGGNWSTGCIRRVPCEDTGEIAATLSRSLDWTATVGDVEAIVRAGGERIEAELERGGWVADRDDWLRRAGRAVEADVARNVLIGWEQIANHIHRSVNTAQRATQWDPPLPVRRLGKLVEADADALDAWAESDPQPRAAVQE